MGHDSDLIPKLKKDPGVLKSMDFSQIKNAANTKSDYA